MKWELGIGSEENKALSCIGNHGRVRAEEIFLPQQKDDSLKASNRLPQGLRYAEPLGAFANPPRSPALKSGFVWHEIAIFID